MTRSRRPRRVTVRECAYCHGPIPDQRPVFLVADKTSAIVGPYHAGCAERLVLTAKRAMGVHTKGAAIWGQLPMTASEGGEL